MKYAIIGAGPSGLSCAKVFKDMGISFQGFESSETVGGLWNFDNPQSPLYPNVHLISSRDKTEFKHFPMSQIEEDYPHHSKVFNYLKRYAKHYDLTKHFRFNTPIKNVERLKDGRWMVEFFGGDFQMFKGVIIATGLYSKPLYPEIKGDFQGKIVHSSKVKEFESYRNKSVLIIGAGNSGCDLACDLSRIASHVGLSMRTGNHIIPKYLLGKPADNTSFGGNLPITLKQLVHEQFLGLISGKMQSFGLPKPKFRIYEKHPIVNSELKYQIGHGHIKVHGEAEKFEGTTVYFSDGVRKSFDTVILATGFKLSFPFISNSHLNLQEGSPQLFLNIFNKNRRNLFIMGMVSSLGLGWEGRYQQALLIGKYLQARKSARFTALKFERLMRKIPDLSGGYNYRNASSENYYVNDQAYMRLLKKGINLLSYG
ncbi:MAG: NAD(P)-binding domain-containing protein [Flavobacteriales bacterium]|nr:NAD(P)-binding domain-containing protein [Flavobacteriales bacterium]